MSCGSGAGVANVRNESSQKASKCSPRANAKKKVPLERNLILRDSIALIAGFDGKHDKRPIGRVQTKFMEANLG